jgi:hypothetical protein
MLRQALEPTRRQGVSFRPSLTQIADLLPAVTWPARPIWVWRWSGRVHVSAIAATGRHVVGLERLTTRRCRAYCQPPPHARLWDLPTFQVCVRSEAALQEPDIRLGQGVWLAGVVAIGGGIADPR